MYASPIVYPLSIVPEKYKILIIANPMTPVIEGFRQAFIGQGSFQISMFLVSLSITIATFFVGIVIFNKVEKSFIDTV